MATLSNRTTLLFGANIGVNAPWDGRHCVADIAARDAIPTKHEGLITYVLSEEKFYALVGGTDNANWTELEVAAEFIATNNDGSDTIVVGPSTVLTTKVYVDGELAGKVDLEAGKGLSTNDYTDADQAAVARIPASFGDLATQDEADLTLTLDQITGLLASLNSKQDLINDIATIRSNALLAVTAIQPADITDVVRQGDITDVLRDTDLTPATGPITNINGRTLEATNVVFGDGAQEVTPWAEGDSNILIPNNRIDDTYFARRLYVDQQLAGYVTDAELNAEANTRLNRDNQLQAAIDAIESGSGDGVDFAGFQEGQLLTADTSGTETRQAWAYADRVTGLDGSEWFEWKLTNAQYNSLPESTRLRDDVIFEITDLGPEGLPDVDGGGGTGLTPEQIEAINTNTAKRSYPQADQEKLARITVTQDIDLDNLGAGGITPEQAAAIDANTAKVGLPD